MMSVAGLLNQTITKQGKSGFNPDGSESYGATTSERCRFQAKSKRVLLPNGQVQAIDAIAFVTSSSSINADDKVTYDGEDYRVISRYKVPGHNGQVHHIKLELRKWQSE